MPAFSLVQLTLISYKIQKVNQMVAQKIIHGEYSTYLETLLYVAKQLDTAAKPNSCTEV